MIVTPEHTIAKKRAIKQCMMRKPFSARTRLPGFTARWNDIRLGDLTAEPSQIGTLPVPCSGPCAPIPGSATTCARAIPEDFARVIPDAALVELDSPTHLFRIGAQRERLLSLLCSFIDD